MNSGPGLGSSENLEALEMWESCCFHARHVTRSVEDLGAAMYPPQVSQCYHGAAGTGCIMGCERVVVLTYVMPASCSTAVAGGLRWWRALLLSDRFPAAWGHTVAGVMLELTPWHCAHNACT
jgi:hypothetical protein